MSIVTTVGTFTLPATEGRKRAITAPYAIFFNEIKAGKHAPAVFNADGTVTAASVVIDCPKDRVHVSELAKSWRSSQVSNIVRKGLEEGIEAKVFQESGDDTSTGLRVRVVYIQRVEPVMKASK